MGVTAAHASPRLAPGVPAEFLDPTGARAAVLPGQIAFGQTFIGDQFTLDYVLWSVDPAVDPARFLQPRSAPTWPNPANRSTSTGPALTAPAAPCAGRGSWSAPNVNSIWVQLEDSFSPNGYSGCPVVSRVTGRLIGMAVAGADLPLATGGAAVVIGLHPAASLVEKAQAALADRTPAR